MRLHSVGGHTISLFQTNEMIVMKGFQFTITQTDKIKQYVYYDRQCREELASCVTSVNPFECEWIRSGSTRNIPAGASKHS